MQNREALTTALEYVNKYGLYTYNLAAHDLDELLRLLLENDVFQ